MNCLIDEDCSNWPFVKSAVAYDVTDSTSERTAEFVREGRLRLPLLVWARSQTRGRGRGRNEWWSDAGSLTFSLAIDPLEYGLAVEIEPRLALATAVAVIDALDTLELGSPLIGIRWPNDIEAGGRKLGGILPECVQTPRGRVLVVGVGLNVATNLADSPAEVRAMATSLAELQAKPLDSRLPDHLLRGIVSRFKSNLPRLASGDPALAHQWAQLDQLRETWICVDLGAHRISGLAQGIDHEGSLRLHDGQQQHRLFGGQVLRTDSS